MVIGSGLPCGFSARRFFVPDTENHHAPFGCPPFLKYLATPPNPTGREPTPPSHREEILRWTIERYIWMLAADKMYQLGGINRGDIVMPLDGNPGQSG